MIYNPQNKQGILTEHKIQLNTRKRNAFLRLSEPPAGRPASCSFCTICHKSLVLMLPHFELLICLLIIFRGFSCQHHNQAASMTHLLFKVIRADFLIVTYPVKHTSMNEWWSFYSWKSCDQSESLLRLTQQMCLLRNCWQCESRLIRIFKPTVTSLRWLCFFCSRSLCEMNWILYL